MHETKFEDGREITSYLATGYAEGFETPTSESDELRAWSYLIGTKMAYSLRGWFGGTAQAIIESGVVDEDGTVNWDLYNNHS